VFQEGSVLLARTCRSVLGLPEYAGFEACAENIDATEHIPVERRVDTLLRLRRDGEEHVVIVEAQCKRDDSKRKSWPYYIAYLHSKHNCPVMLLIVCNDSAVARWARDPIDVGPRRYPCQRTQPFVLGSDNMPMITDLSEASADVEFTVLSALIHSKSKKARAILNVLATALDGLDIPTAERFAGLTAAGLGSPDARQHWRDLMTAHTYRYESELTEELRAEGRAEGQATMLLRVLQARGLDLSDELRERILSCSDSETLNAWADRAVIAKSADEIFD